MDHSRIFQALANEMRLLILKWLSDPKKYFPAIEYPQIEGADMLSIGVCGKHIQKKSKLSQSTISQYLNLMQQAGLVESTRMGQWTFFRRKEQTLLDLSEYIKREL